VPHGEILDETGRRTGSLQWLSAISLVKRRSRQLEHLAVHLDALSPMVRSDVHRELAQVAADD